MSRPTAGRPPSSAIPAATMMWADELRTLDPRPTCRTRMMGQDYSFDAKRFCLGTLCKRGHAWADTNQSLRRATSGHGTCIECEKIYVSNRRNTPEKDAYRRKYANEYYKAKNKLSRPSRSKHALPGESRDDAAARLRAERIANEVLPKAIRSAGRSPSVAQLVMEAQREYWREHPEAKREHDRQ